MSRTDLNIVIESIKSKLQLSKVVGMDVALKRKGREFVGQCPFHLEKTGSFFVNDEKGTFYCFGCGASGDLIEYVKKKERIQFHQAIEKLAAMAGVKLPEKVEYHQGFDQQKKLLQKAMEFFKNNLMKNKVALKYCEDRTIDPELIDKFSIGYADDDGNSLLSYIRQGGFSDEDIADSGLFIWKGKSCIPRFKNRLMFPVFNRDGWPIAFGGRGISGVSRPKYLNSPETALFQKRETLYGYNVASRNASENKQLIIVEGYIDVVTMHKFGFDTTIGSMGTALSSEHIAKIWKYSDEPIICFDGDEAGETAMIRALHTAMHYLRPGKSVRFCILPRKSDPDSLLRNNRLLSKSSQQKNDYGEFGKKSNGIKEMEDLLSRSLSCIDFFWTYCLQQLECFRYKTPENIAQWKKDINTFIEDIQDLEIRKLYNAEIKDRLYIFNQQNKRNNNAYKSINLRAIVIDKHEKILLKEALLLYIIIMRPSIVSFVAEELATVELSDLGFEEIRGVLLSLTETEVPDFTGLEEVVVNIKSMCCNHCNFNIMNDEEALSFWRSIFRHGFVGASQKRDLIAVKEECTQTLSSEKWERLKALKIDSLYKGNVSDD
jgi:DNA primase